MCVLMMDKPRGMMMKAVFHRAPLRASVLAMAMTAALLAGCSRSPETPAADPSTLPAAVDEGAAPTPTETTAPALADVIENTPQAVIGISYAAGLDAWPGLARVLQGYADAARAELQQAVEGLGNDKPSAPYELSLAFEKRLQTPQLVVVSAEGSRYTGGAHGEPLVARFVWLPEHDAQLTAEALIADADGWKAVSQYVADQLRERAATRLSSEDMEAGQMQESLRSLGRMIADGTGAKAANFSQFEPLTDAQGRITALRFVFPPYQVGPYSDGTQTADVPAAVLLPHVAEPYKALFARN